MCVAQYRNEIGQEEQWGLTRKRLKERKLG